jgi:D-alanyl-lipoteichoic acid acyltransferase DltB (MBOAT superfamily)
LESLATQLAELYNMFSASLDSLGVDLDKLKDMLVYDSRQPMLFNTGMFLVLFAGFMLLYRALRPWRVPRMIFTILFSLYFYYKTSGDCYMILIGVAVSDYILGLCMQRARSLDVGRVVAMRLIAALNVCVNIGMLAYFKYFGLMIDTINRFFTAEIDPINVLLPAGISFFTFRSISYIIDIYRGQIDACRNPLDYLFFLTFFPPLLAGPVVRAKDMLPQINGNPVATRDMTSEGIYLIILGIIKKMVIADFISGNFVDRVFDNPALYSGFENLMASMGFTIQLYCDFSGYSDIAIGIALLLGYRFKENFNAPFKATNPTEFWHRWHISLSTWLRDYVYIPLGGNRCSKPRAYFNQFATMVIGGLWHGASWMYVIWGATHGALLVIHKMTRGFLPATEVTETVVSDTGEVEVLTVQSRMAPVIRFVNMVVTFMLVSFAFMMFRAGSMEDVGMMWHQIIYDFHPSVASQFVSSYMTIVIAMVVGYVVHVLPSGFTSLFRKGFMASPAVAQALLLALALYVAIQVRSSDIVPFIYLQY